MFHLHSGLTISWRIRAPWGPPLRAQRTGDPQGVARPKTGCEKQIASLGVVAVVLLLAKFFPRVYGGLLEQTQKITKADAAELLKQGNIIGFVYGDSEVGPRALGNRSIVCDPNIKEMKDIQYALTRTEN